MPSYDIDRQKKEGYNGKKGTKNMETKRKKGAPPRYDDIQRGGDPDGDRLGAPQHRGCQGTWYLHRHPAQLAESRRRKTARIGTAGEFGSSRQRFAPCASRMAGLRGSIPPFLLIGIYENVTRSPVGWNFYIAFSRKNCIILNERE